jgi:transcription elongation factor Elf1
MAELYFTCPKTHARAPCGIETDVKTLSKLGRKKITIKCSACGDMHALSVRETYLNGVLDEVLDRGGTPVL